MAARSVLSGVSLVLLLTVSIFPTESEAAIASKHVNQMSVQEKQQWKLSSKQLANDFSFADDEDMPMRGDDSFASSGDGPDPEPFTELKLAPAVNSTLQADHKSPKTEGDDTFASSGDGPNSEPTAELTQAQNVETKVQEELQTSKTEGDGESPDPEPSAEEAQVADVETNPEEELQSSETEGEDDDLDPEPSAEQAQVADVETNPEEELQSSETEGDDDDADPEPSAEQAQVPDVETNPQEELQTTETNEDGHAPNTEHSAELNQAPAVDSNLREDLQALRIEEDNESPDPKPSAEQTEAPDVDTTLQEDLVTTETSVNGDGPYPEPSAELNQAQVVNRTLQEELSSSNTEGDGDVHYPEPSAERTQAPIVQTSLQEELQTPKTDNPHKPLSSPSPSPHEDSQIDWDFYSENGWNETTPEETLPDDYYPIGMCHDTKYFCRHGHRGPCHRNEIFTATSLATDSALFQRQPTCSTVFRENTCFPSLEHIYSLANKPLGVCQVRYPSRPCSGYPSYYRYCKTTKRCYPCKTRTTTSPSTSGYTLRGPCRADQIFTATDDHYGRCTCRRPNYIDCKKTNRCQAAYTKGACPQGQWLVPSNYGGVCRPCPCPSLADGRHMYWSARERNYGRPGCYESNTQGPCRPGTYFRIENFATGSWRCVPRQFDNRRGLYSLIKDWQLLNDMSFFGPNADYDSMDDIFGAPWF